MSSFGAGIFVAVLALLWWGIRIDRELKRAALEELRALIERHAKEADALRAQTEEFRASVAAEPRIPVVPAGEPVIFTERKRERE